MKLWLHDNNNEMYSTHNEEKPIVAGRLVSTLKTKILKYMTAVSKNVCINKLDERVDN